MNTPHPAVDIDAVDRCPIGLRCETCDSSTDLEVAAADTPVGVLCVTLCARCRKAAAVPAINIRSWTAAIERVCDHCGHLGIDLDTMAAIIAAEHVNDRDPYAAGDGHPLFGGPQ